MALHKDIVAAALLIRGRRSQGGEALWRNTTEQARAVRVQWAFAPVADVNSNPANPIINTRPFGEDLEAVGSMVAAFIRGAHEHGMLVTAKHFPGR